MAAIDDLRRLDAKLNAERGHLDFFQSYYTGDHRLQFATSKYRAAFGRTFSAFADNWCPIIVDAAAERMQIDGIRFGDVEGNDEAVGKLFEDNRLDLMAGIVHTDAIKFGRSAVLVDRTGSKPVITAEDPRQCYVEMDTAKPFERAIGLKTWRVEKNVRRAILFYPNVAIQFRTASDFRDGREPEKINWTEERRIAHGTGVVPLIPFVNLPDASMQGRSDLHNAIPLQDAINKYMTDMLVASEFQAYRQRVLTGVEVPRYPEGHPQAGQPIKDNEMIAAMTRLFVLEPPDAKLQDLPAADLVPYTTAIKTTLQHLAAQTRTPPHYLLGEMVNISGDALVAAEAGLVHRVHAKQRSFSPSWIEAVKLALKREDETAKVRWAPAEKIPMGALGDYLVKLDSINVPREALWSRAGFTPAEIEEFNTILEERKAPPTPTIVMPPAAPGTKPFDQQAKPFDQQASEDA